jgi:hypothetical protein
MLFRLFWWAHIACAITTAGGVCIFAFLKSLTQAACASDDLYNQTVVNATDSQQSLGSNHSQAITASLAWAATAVVANAAFLSFKLRAKQGLALAAAICANWQPAYFLLVSIERIVLLAVMVVGYESAGSCGFSLYQHGHILATQLLMPVALLIFALSAICCDHDPDCTPAMRRGAYCASTACFVLDMICSFVWGFGTKTNRDHLSFGPVTFILAEQINSCIITQAVVFLHLLYVSCRSRGGRGWAYASLRFELVKQHDVGTLLGEPPCSSIAPQMSSPNGALECMQVADMQAKVHTNVFSRLRHRFLRFQRQSLQESQVFAIPCVESSSYPTSGPKTASGLQMVRPLFRIKFPDFIVRSAELHPNIYSCVLLAFGLGHIACFQLQTRVADQGTAAMVLGIIVMVGLLGFFSCKRHNVDSIAAKHVSTSFRFVSICVLCLFAVAFTVRSSYLGYRTPQSVVSGITTYMAFVLCLLVDCCPTLPKIVQTVISVRVCIVPF